MITGYKYTTEEQAIAARKAAADYYGLPITPESTTLYFVDYTYSHADEFYYIVWCEGCTEALGEPIDFQITQDYEPIL